MHQDEFDVVISGYGPTGMVAASLLAQRGHKVCVFERWPSLYGQPRMATIDGETARIIQNSGNTEDAFRHSVARPRYIQANEASQVLIDHDWNKEHICGFPHRISLHQPDIEDAMDAMARQNGAEINQSWEVQAISQDDTGVLVTAQYREPDGTLTGAPRVVRARYLIGSDGARSTVRRLLGIEREGWPFRDAWLSIDATRKRELPNLLGLSPDGRIAVIFCAPEGRSHSIIPLGLNHLRFNFRIDPDTPHDGQLHREDALRQIKEVYGVTEDDIEVYREALYPFEGKLAKRWRQGRIFLAGDAAHSMTPFYGQGGCSGLRDSINLAWKLDLVLTGKADEKLLDTYEAERIPHVRVHIDNSDKLGALIFMMDPAEAAERDRKLLAGQGEPPKPEPLTDQGIVDRIDGRAMAPVGTIGPQGMVSSKGHEARLDDVVGWGFQVVVESEAVLAKLSPDQDALLTSTGAHVAIMDGGQGKRSFADVSGVYRDYFKQYGLTFFVMRPDFIIFGAGSTVEDLSRVIDSLGAQLQGRQAKSIAA
jgi:3-(3-hydroxy-phenyl)propionate hydroxylase